MLRAGPGCAGTARSCLQSPAHPAGPSTALSLAIPHLTVPSTLETKPKPLLPQRLLLAGRAADGKAPELVFKSP